MNTVNLVVRLPESLRQQVKALAALRGETVSDVVREALSTYVAGGVPGSEIRATKVNTHLAEPGPTYSAEGSGVGLGYQGVSEDQIAQALHMLARDRWADVLDFIDYLRLRAQPLPPSHLELTARELVQSDLVGLWATREDIGDTLEYARQLRHQAEHRRRNSDASA